MLGHGRNTDFLKAEPIQTWLKSWILGDSFFRSVDNSLGLLKNTVIPEEWEA
jgi:hypothetical protein